MSTRYLTITHPEQGEATIVASSLPVYEERGWTAKPELDAEGNPVTQPVVPAQPE